MTMMKTAPFVPFSKAFDADLTLKGTKIEATELESYERPSDKILSHVLEYQIVQSGLFGMLNKKIRIDCFKKVVQIIGETEGPTRSFSGRDLRRFEVDNKESRLVKMYLKNNREIISFYMDSPELIEKLFESLNYLLEISAKRE